MRAQKRDVNESELITAAEALGCSVEQLPGGNGRPDLLIGEPESKENILIEVKDATGRLSAKQKLWHANWNGRVHVARTEKDVIDIIEFYRSCSI